MASPRLPWLAALALCAGATVLGTPRAAASGVTRVGDTQPGWAVPANDAGDEPGSRSLVFSVWLGWHDQAGLDRTLADLQDPSSPEYHHWLTPDEFRSRFSPGRQSLRDVTGWLRDQGFEILAVPRNRLFVTARGSVAQVEQTFQLNENVYRVDGRLINGPSADPIIPTALAGTVMAITGLDGAMALAEPRHGTPAPPPPAGRSVGPCSHYWGQAESTRFPNPYQPGRPLPWIICGYTPSQIASAYGIDRLRQLGLDGRGQTIAITGAFFSPTIRTDFDAFSRHYGLPRLDGRRYREYVAPGTLRYPNDPAETQSWYIEQSLDIEWAHAVAPRAQIRYVGAANDARGLDQALNYVVDQHLADIVSNSWGLPEVYASRGEMKAVNAIFQQGVAQGMGIYFASGDNGDDQAATGKLSVGFPDSSPWVTSVGGTSLAVGEDGARLWETGWGTTESVWRAGGWAPTAPGDFLYGAGGGVSRVFAQPAYQAGVVPRELSLWQGRPHRAEPDLSMVADPQTGAVFSQSYSLPGGGTTVIDSWIGGTSLATPLTAGLMALADQASGAPHGFINPRLYALAGSSAFHDITPSGGTLAVLRNGLLPGGGVITRLRGLDRDSTLATRVGWDPVTGLGSPAAPELVAALLR